MHFTPPWPGSAGDPNQPRLYPTMHRGSLSSHLGLGPRHLSDHNPSDSGMQTPSEIMWTSCGNCTTMRHLCHLISRPLSWKAWVLRVPTLFIFNLFLSYCMLI